MKLYPKAPAWHPCSKSGHCVHRIEGKGFLCCSCPVRAFAPADDGLIYTEASHADIGAVTGRPWSMSFEIPNTKEAQDEIRYFRKKMGWPWPCQNGCNRIAESPESYWCDVDPPCQPEKNYVAGIYAEEWPK